MVFLELRQKSPDTPGSLEGNTEGPGTASSAGAELRPADRWQEKGWDESREPHQERACSGQGRTPVSEAFLALPHPWGALDSNLVWTLC